MASKSSTNKTVKRASKKAIKTVKKNKAGFVIVAAFFIVFAVGGFVAASYLMKNDGFTLVVPEKEIRLEINDVYEERGAELVICGKKLEGLYEIKIYDSEGCEAEAIDTSADTTYDVVYTAKPQNSEDFLIKFFGKRYEDYKQVRHIVVGEGE